MGKTDYTELDIAQLMEFDAIRCKNFFPPFFIEDNQGTQSHGDGIIKTRDDLRKVKFPKLDDNFFEYPKKFIERYGKLDYALYYRSRMGVSGVLNSMGLEGFSYAMMDDVKTVELLLEMYTEWVSELLDKTKNMGFDFVMFSDDMAYTTGPMFSPQVFKEIFLPRLKKVKEHITTPWVFHSDGKLDLLMDDLLSLGMNGINPLEPESMDIEKVKKEIGHKLCLIGNISVDTLTRGTIEEVEAQVKKRIEIIGQGGGYIISSSNSIASYCNTENVLAFRDAVVKYRNCYNK